MVSAAAPGQRRRKPGRGRRISFAELDRLVRERPLQVPPDAVPPLHVMARRRELLRAASETEPGRQIPPEPPRPLADIATPKETPS
jgi:hypothetical protein